MIELSANMSWLDPLDWQELQAFEPVNDTANDLDSVERIAQVEATAAALFQPFFETGLMGFDRCPRDEGASNYLLRIHCARSFQGYADYSRHPALVTSADSMASMEEWEALLANADTPSARQHIPNTPSPARKPTSAFKPNRPKNPPTPVSHTKTVQKVEYCPLSASAPRDQCPGLHQTQSASTSSKVGAGQPRVATPESDTDSGEEDSGDEPIEPRRAVFKQLSSSTLVNSDTQASSGAPTRDNAIADLIRGIAEDSQEIGL